MKKYTKEDVLDIVNECKFAPNAKVLKLLNKANPNVKEVAEAVKTTKAYKENQNDLKTIVDGYLAGIENEEKGKSTTQETKSSNSERSAEPPRRRY